jgi:hypothetical protein
LKKFWPGGIHGYDKKGCPIWIDVPGYADVKGLKGTPEQLILLKLPFC